VKIPPVELREHERLTFGVEGELLRVESIHQPKDGRGTWVDVMANLEAVDADPLAMAVVIRADLDAAEEAIRMAKTA